VIVCRLKALRILALFLVGPAPAAFGGFNTWTTSGPHEVTLSSLAVDPSDASMIYASQQGSSGSLFKSTDGGTSWSPLSQTSGTVVVDPANGQRLFLYNSSSFRESTDGGMTWQDTGNGINASAVTAVVFDPTNSSRIYAGTTGGVYFTTDGGTIWSLVSLSGLTNSQVNALVIDATNPMDLFAGTNGGGVFGSTDGGASWALAGASLQSAVVKILAIDPTTPTTLYAHTTSPSIDLYKSTDSGTTWATIESGLGSRNVSAFLVDPAAATTLFSATADAGVFKSMDGGASWNAASSGLPVVNVSSIGLDSATGLILDAAAGPFGMYKSTDGGSSWAPAGYFPLPVMAWPTVDPVNPALVYAGAAGISRSFDGGGSWAPFTDSVGRAIVVDPIVPQTLYAEDLYLEKSTDSGLTWLQIFGNGLGSLVTIDSSNHNTIYGLDNGGVSRSTDAGATFTNLPNAGTHTCFLTVDPNDSTALYAGWCAQGIGLEKSVNSGASWLSIDPNGSSVDSVLVDPTNSSVVYALSSPMSKSTDGGSTWTVVGSGLPSGAAAAAVMDPANPSTLYAVTLISGVYKSTDGALTWSAMNDGLTDLTAFSITISSSGRSLHVGTDSGVFDFNYDFLDVPQSNPFHDFVNRIAADGITAGCASAYFCPTDAVVRSQMAVFLLRSEHGSTYVPPACTPPGIFTDVSCPGTGFTDWIYQLVAEGITGGCTATTFCPNDPVTRSSMAVFLLVAQHGAGYAPPACTTATFTDVPCSNPFSSWIYQLVAEGVTGGCTATTYCPGDPVLRAQMAVFLTVTFNLP
jgi:photosystem II stability/assembly factor-like uncharacterized protein